MAYKTGRRKLTAVLVIVACTTVLGILNIVDGGNITAIFCTSISLFSVANMTEHLTIRKD
jgi:hypothetical protein